MTAWLFLSLLFPFIGFFVYLIAGRRMKREIGEVERINELDFQVKLDVCKPDEILESSKQPNESNVSFKRLYALLSELAPFPITSHNKTVVLTNGEETFASILAELRKAEHHIHLEYYTIRNDGVGSKVLAVLMEKARQGVEVRVIYDGIGSLQLDKDFLERLHEAGGRSACFSPPRIALLNRRINFRNHRKIIVVDGKVGFLGGINIGDEYLGLDKKLGFWRDTHLYIQGEAAYYMQLIFMSDWLRVTSKQFSEDKRYFPPIHSANNERVLIVPGKPGINDQKIVEVLFSAMAMARTRIYATTPYFIPDPSLAASLRTAARSGIDVQLIIPGISDSKLVLMATLSYVQDMLEAGVRIFRYQKGFIHAKVLIIDDMLASVGTANLDMRSLYSNYELLALLFDEKPIRKLEEDFLNDLKHSEEIDPERFKRRSGKQKAAEAIMHMLSPLL